MNGLLARLAGRLGAAVAAVRRPAAPTAQFEKLLLSSEQSSPPTRGTAGRLQMFNEHPILRAAADRISDGCASAPWHVHDRRGTRDDLPNHPLLTLANPFMSRSALIKLATLHLDLAGEAFLVIECDEKGVPIALWPLPPTAIASVARPNRPRFKVQIEGRQFDLPANEVMHIRDLDPADPYGRGSGTAAALSDELETDEFAAKHVKSFFYNQARPDLLITLEGARDPDLKAAEQRWNDRLQGFYRAFKPFFANRAIDVKEIGTTFRDQQFVQLRQHERDIVLQTFGVPPEIVGVIENSNRATITAASLIFAKYVLIPRLELIRETFQADLVPLFGGDLELSYESPVPADAELELEAMKAAPWAAMTDEWREMQGLKPLPNGEGRTFAIPANMRIVEQLKDARPTLPSVLPQDFVP